MIHFSHPATLMSTPMTFLPMRQPNDEANLSSATKRRSLSTTPTRRSPNASETNSRRQSMRTTWLSLMIQMRVSPMYTPASSTNTLLIDMQKLIYEWPTTIVNSSTHQWTPPNRWWFIQNSGALSSICCRCQQSNQHGRHGANGGDRCGGNQSHA